MKTIFTFLLAFISSSAIAADTEGIKAANLVGADVELMKNHDPASELENFELLPGYEANLFAAEPMLANPVHMHWDTRGRLWVACSWAYPQLKPGEEANDKIIILEDTDDDGVADKSTVFADGLYVPTGLELANGGCYVGQSPDVYFFKDTDGDDVADVKQLALTGFGIEDSHHSISAWRRGPGGWIYFQEGIFLHSQVETQYGVVRNFNGGVYQFNPRTQQLRIFCTGTSGNPWGHAFDRWGQSFMVNNPRIMYLSPATGASDEVSPVKTLISTEKQCGGEFATGTHIGDDIRGQLLSGRFKSRAIIRYEIIENGAGFSANVLKPLLTSKHPNFRPVDVKMGPDGAIYVADWYNSIINHAQHDFRDPRRDHTHGRVWRITHKERPLTEKPKLEGAPLAAVIDQLKSAEPFTRSQTRKELSERDFDEVHAALETWVDGLDANDTNYARNLVEAMWACQNVERPSEKILKLVLNSKDGGARSAGARVLRYWHQDLSDPIEMIASAAADDFPRTRMEAVLSAGFIPNAEAYAAALHAIDMPADPFVDQALKQTRNALAEYWRPALEAEKLVFAKDSHREYVEREAGIGFGQRLAELIKSKSAKPEELSAVKDQLVKFGTANDVRAAVKALVGKRRPKGAVSVALLEGLRDKGNAPNPPKKMERTMQSLKALLKPNTHETIAVLAAENLGAWKVAPQVLADALKNEKRRAVRQAAAIGLGRSEKTEYRQLLVKLADEGDMETRYLAVAGLAFADFDISAQSLAKLFAEDPGTADPIPALQSILKDRRGANALVTYLADLELNPKVVSLVNDYHRRTGQLPKALIRSFQPPPGSQNTLSERLLVENQEKLAADVVKLGDPHRGEMIYRRRELACMSCHAIGSAGPEIGPNLVAVGAAAGPAYMVESILEPNAAIAEHFENRLFQLADGTVRIGVITFKSEKEVVVRDSAQMGKEIRLDAAQITREREMPSLMPAGLADQLKSRQEFLDLASFLSVLGRPGDFANDESPVIRKWSVNVDDTWITSYSKVDGELPAADLPGEKVKVRGYVEVQVAGQAKLEINSAAGLEFWVDDQHISDPSSEFQLKEGRRTLTFIVDSAKRGESGLRVEIQTPTGSKLKFQPEGGM